MNPPVVVNQFRMATIALLVCAVGTSESLRIFTVIACCALLLYWLVLKTTYAVSARTRMRSNSRMDGDRDIARAALIQAGAPLLVVLAGHYAAVVHFLPLNDWGIPSEVAAAAAILLLSLHTSSLVDWYWIRPRRDGITSLPVCHDPSIPRRKLLTRVQLWHRAITVLVFGVCASVLVYFVLYEIFQAVPQNSFWSGYTSALSGPLSLVVFGLVGYRTGFFESIKVLGGGTRVKYGDTISTQVGATRIRGKVFEVSLEGLTIVTLTGDRHLTPLVDPELVVHQNAQEDGYCPRPSNGGPEPICGALDEDRKCQFGAQRLVRSPNGDTYEELPKDHRPVGLFAPW